MSDYTVYMLKRAGEIIYIGSTKNLLSRRLSEHRSTKNLGIDVVIEKICIVQSKEAAQTNEYTLINLIGRHRLLNVNYGRMIRGRRENLFRNKKKVLWDESAKKKHSLRLKGIKKDPSAKNKTLKKLGFAEFDIHIEDKYIGRFINQTEAAKACGLKKSTFVDIFKGKRINTKGIKVTQCVQQEL